VKTLLKVIVVFVVLMSVMRSCGPMGGAHPLTGQPSPDFHLSDLEGQRMDMQPLRAGQPAILFFWATWCPHCRTQLRELSMQAENIESKGIRIILVNVGEGPTEVTAYLQNNDIDLPVLLDTDDEVSKRYKIVGLPTFFLIGRDGLIISVVHGLPGNYEDLLLASLP